MVPEASMRPATSIEVMSKYLLELRACRNNLNLMSVPQVPQQFLLVYQKKQLKDLAGCSGRRAT